MCQITVMRSAPDSRGIGVTCTGYCTDGDDGDSDCFVTRADRFPNGLALDTTDTQDILVDPDSDEINAKLGIADRNVNAAN